MQQALTSNNTTPEKLSFDPHALRQDFPALQQMIRNKPLVYLDNAASCQTPQQVIDALLGFYTQDRSNIHRGVHTLSQRATRQYEEARIKVQQFLNAADAKECIFVRGTTEAINLVAQTYGRANVGPGDEIIVSAMEHHSNIVPWQMLCEETQATLKVIPMDERGVLDLDAYDKMLNERTKLVSVVHVSNALGTINDVQHIIQRAHQLDVPVLLDGAQATPHMPIDVQALDCDFYTLSGHKLYGPTGIGVLYGKEKLLDAMPPYHGGGDMIRSVSFEHTEYAGLPSKFEAGTPHIAGGIGLGAAVDYLTKVGMAQIAAYEQQLLTYATDALSSISKARIIGTAPQKAGVLSFVIDGVHPHDLGTILDMEGVAIRAGHHCAQPVMDFFCLSATARASFAAFNTREDVDTLIRAIHKAIEMFQ